MSGFEPRHTANCSLTDNPIFQVEKWQLNSCTSGRASVASWQRRYLSANGYYLKCLPKSTDHFIQIRIHLQLPKFYFQVVSTLFFLPTMKSNFNFWTAATIPLNNLLSTCNSLKSMVFAVQKDPCANVREVVPSFCKKKKIKIPKHKKSKGRFSAEIFRTNLVFEIFDYLTWVCLIID